ncbi:hypothetical protein KTI55_14530 [Acinetobacter ursingii]|uniref:virulence factor TspB C-terminal domain-related protein n=1 Tax=Acinetobacter ursingii TaxID=108980 RepID=UPI0021CDCD6F|nr:virulence factor TspB C-terminal domain-related protein [Acinetobacter ursingii]MCU4497757.1 hypothetical protein [Acinetobacter ursingii]
MPFNAARAAGLGGWSLGGGVAQGASIVYNGSKQIILNGASKIATGVAKITPPPSSVAKALAGGAGAIALDLALQELLGGVDYVLDPANNSVKYSDPNAGTGQFLFGINDQELAFTPSGACAKSSERTQSQWVGKLRLDSSRGSYGYCISDAFPNGWTIMRYNNPAYDPAAEEENRKSIPLETVAQQVISNAAAGNAAAQQAVKAAADTMVAEAETDSSKARPIINQLEASQSVPTSETATGETVPKDQTGENTGADAKGSDISLQFPIFCNWAPTVCQAANVVIQKPAEWAENIKAAYDDAVDYFKSEPEETDNELDIDQSTETEPDSSVSFSTSCPAKIPLTFQWNGGTLDFSFDFTMWCQAISTFVYPIVVALGSLHALYIVAGVRQDG